MKSSFAATLAAVIFTGLCQPAFAEKWVSVGTLQPIGVELTVDTDSTARNGDLTTIQARPVNVNDPKAEKLTVDCKRRALLVSGQNWPVDKDFVDLRKTWPRAMLTKIWELACR
jgi:hypothetical protein